MKNGISPSPAAPSAAFVAGPREEDTVGMLLASRYDKSVGDASGAGVGHDPTSRRAPLRGPGHEADLFSGRRG